MIRKKNPKKTKHLFPKTNLENFLNLSNPQLYREYLNPFPALTKIQLYKLRVCLGNWFISPLRNTIIAHYKMIFK